MAVNSLLAKITLPKKTCQLDAPKKSIHINSKGMFICQRAENGGSDPSWLDLAFLGRPDFPSRGAKTYLNK